MRPTFTPFNFQAPLAAGGVTLMAFNWLQSVVPHGRGPLVLADISWGAMTPTQASLYGLLVGIMFVLTIVNLVLTALFGVDLMRWLHDGHSLREFMGGPPARVTGIFVPIASLAMTMAVVFAAVPFFIPAIAGSVQALVPPGVVIFLALCVVAFGIESRLLLRLATEPIDTTKLTFVWLLDVFAFGLVALAGSGLASMAAEPLLASLSASAATATAVVGTLLLVGKLAVLARVHLRSRSLPEHQLQPAFFLLVPITCLYAVSYYRILGYAQKSFGLDLSLPSQYLIILSYGVAVAWALFTFGLLVSYFTRYFRKSEYFPTQWSMV